MSGRASISICIPAYQAGEYVATAVESVLNQTVLPDDVVVSNNWSTDGTEGILRRYQERVRIERPPAHLSMSDHYWYIAERAAGDYVVWLDADNALHPRFIETVGPFLREYSMIATGRFDCDANLRPFGYSGLAYMRHKRAAPGALFDEFLGGCRHSHSGTAWDRAWLLSLPKLPKEAEYVTDWYLGIVAAAYRPIAMIPAPRHYYRFHSHNASHSEPERWRRSAKAMLDWLASGDLLSEDRRAAVRQRSELLGHGQPGEGSRTVGFLAGVKQSARNAVSWCACRAAAHPAYLR